MTARDKGIEIVKLIGGYENVDTIDKCVTRLRIQLKDNTKADLEEIKKIDGILDAINQRGETQIVIGEKVEEIYDEILDAYPILKKAVKKPEKKSLFGNIFGGAFSSNKKAKKADKTEVKAMEPPKAKGKLEIFSPSSGKLIELKDVTDDVFSNEILGKGMAIDAIEGKVYAPVDGTIEVVFETEHAIAMKAGDVEIIIHVGVDTVNLTTGRFDAKCKVGDTVKKGDLLLEFDKEGIIEDGYVADVIMVVSNTLIFEEVLTVSGEKDLEVGELVITVNK